MPWGSQEPEIEWFMDIRNPQHPYYSEYKEMKKDNIFNHPRVHDWSGGLDTVNIKNFPYKLSYYKEKIIEDIMSSIDSIAEKLNTCMEQKQLVIYGIGIVGKIFVGQVKEKGMEVAYILDKNKPCCKFQSINVYNLDETEKLSKNVIIVVTPLIKMEEVVGELRTLGYKSKIMHVKELLENKEMIKKITSIIE